MTLERIRCVGILAMCVMPVMRYKREPQIATAWFARLFRLNYSYGLLLIKKQELEEKILYNRLMEEKAKRLGFELVPKFLPSVRIKLGNKLVHRYRMTRLTFLAALNNFFIRR